MNFKLARNVWANKQVYALLLASFYTEIKSNDIKMCNFISTP